MRIRIILFVLTYGLRLQLMGQVDPLPSWNDSTAKQKIVQLVNEVINKDSSSYVAPEERIATIDQDGTLWVEQPLYAQMFFALDRIKAMAPSHPEWKGKEPYQTIVDGDFAKIEHFKESDIEHILAQTLAGMTIDQYHQQVKDWLATAVHPRFKRPFTQLVYQPMLEAVKYLKANDFKVYIVSGGGQEFIRVYADKVYGISTDRIIGTPGKAKYEYRNGNPVLEKLSAVLYINNNGGKVEGINLFIGKRPIISFGNSTGDREMSEWTQAGKGKNLELLVHHDDAVREYAYGPNSKIGHFPQELLDQAKQDGWIVISMKNDWKSIFSWE